MVMGCLLTVLVGFVLVVIISMNGWGEWIDKLDNELIMLMKLLIVLVKLLIVLVKLLIVY